MSETREKLINIATQTIQKSGIHKLTMRDLGEAVNIKSSSVMYHFKSKDKLMVELAKVYNENFFKHLEDIEKDYESPKERLVKLVEIFESVLQEDKLCLCGMLASESDNLDIDLKNQTVEFFIDLEKWVSKNLKLLNTDESLSHIIVSALEGALLIDKLEIKNRRLHSIKEWIKNI